MIIETTLHGFRQVPAEWLDDVDPAKTRPLKPSPRFDAENRMPGVEMRLASDTEQADDITRCYVYTDADPEETCECLYCTEQMKIFCL